MAKQYDAIVIGAGIIGACVGFELAKQGKKVLNVDKLSGSGFGSTSGSCAIIRLHYSTPDGVAMAREGYYYWLDWVRYLGVVDPTGLVKYINTGCLVIKTEKNHYLKNVMASLDELNVCYEELDPEGIKKLMTIADTRQFGPPVTQKDPRFGEPTADAVAGAIYVPESGLISDPKQSVHNVQKAGENVGGEYLFKAKVVEILKKEGRCAGIKLEDGTEIHAPVVVNVAGPHSYQINEMAGVTQGMKIKTRPLKQEVCHVPSPEGFDYNNLGTIISDGDVGCYSRPEIGNHVLIGSEDPECDTLDYVDDPDTYDTNFTEQWTTQVMREAQRLKGLPIPGPGKAQGIVDLYDASDDWIPIYDKSDLPGFYMAVGTSGNQYKNAPVVGVLMAELIEGCEGGQDHDKDPIKFKMHYTKRECDIGFFSRLREINPNSSFSVIG
ncbi:NAD(P)/FAD-dependent oxidoreductase [Desulfospira joergensenii]|uniref:NAD(P)/FAD-dependent oxidoreductase n=1 Tax=Desulfospira joergensenii TaxID=53329 RepID=UPI0003B41DBE|nr:FAD-dependent oxidoreductase [Desulfospira joergensenii]